LSGVVASPRRLSVVSAHVNCGLGKGGIWARIVILAGGFGR
jgi:hypothetical protein